MRIVGGQFRGRSLAAPKSNLVRPTTDRTREALFNIIVHSWPQLLDGGRVLDLFAGTGALGLEAMSRGAGFGLFVDQSAEGRALLRTNIEALGLSGRAKIFRRDATDLGVPGTMAPFDLVFADPPYGKGLGEKALAALVAGGWLAPGALVIVEEAASATFSAPGYELLDERQWGDTVVRFFRIAAA